MDEDLKEFLMKHVTICVGKIPNRHSEMNDLLWKSFELGRKYERKITDTKQKGKSYESLEKWKTTT